MCLPRKKYPTFLANGDAVKVFELTSWRWGKVLGERNIIERV
jgi:hypothetical protein